MTRDEQIQALAAALSSIKGRSPLNEIYAQRLYDEAGVRIQPELEYGWAGDALATTFYPTQEAAEEFMGIPKKFVRTKAGPWREALPSVHPDPMTEFDLSSGGV